jgi:hypothetical protein
MALGAGPSGLIPSPRRRAFLLLSESVGLGHLLKIAELLLAVLDRLLARFCSAPLAWKAP